MIKKIFLFAFVIFLSWTVKAQTTEFNHSHAFDPEAPTQSQKGSSVIDFPIQLFTEEIIAKKIDEYRNQGTKEWELDKLNKFMHKEMQRQQQNIALGNTNQRTIQQPLQVNSTGCINPGFENGTNSNWTFNSGDINSGTLPCNTCPNTPGAINLVVTNASTAGASPAGSQCTAGTDVYGLYPIVPTTGGTYVLLLNNGMSGGKIMKASYTFIVNPASVLYNFRYAVDLNTGGSSHTATQQPYFHVDVTDNTTNSIIPCTQYDQVAPSSGALNGWTISGTQANGTDVYFKPWTSVGIDLSAVPNHTVTISYIVSDCTQGGHFGYAYIDADCAPDQITLTKALCAGGSPAILTGPPGYASYTWTGPVTGNAQNLSTTVPGTYHLATTSSTGCPSPAITYILSANPAPVPSFTTTTVACSGAVTFIDGSSIAAPDNITNWVWNYGDGSASVNATTAANQTHPYATPGNYTVTLTDTTNNHCTGTYSFVVNAGGGGPNPSFSSNSPASAPQCLTGNNVVFTNASTTTGSVTITGYNWDFGDGSTASSTTVTPGTSHSYTASGTYVVTLTVNVTGCSATTTQTVVINPMPTAIIKAPTVCLGTATAFTSTITPAGVTYNWSFGDAGTNTTSATPSHTYATASTFPVTLTVTTAPGGCTVTATTNAVVTPLPTASFSVAQVCQGTASVFVNTSVSDSACVWSFGGTGSPASAITNCNPSYTYSNSGTFAVTLSVTATGGCKATATGSAVVNPMPTLTFTANNPCEGANVTFNNLTANQVSFSNWNWTFGDGGNDITSTPPAHSYTAGCYPVVLTATTTTGCTGTYSSTVYVHPNPGISFTAFEVCLGDSAEFVDSSYVQNPACLTDNIASWNWNYGDGTGAHLITNMPDTLKYLYTTCGPKNISFTVTTNYGCTNTVTLTGDTIFCPPVVTAPPSFSVCPGVAVANQTFSTSVTNGGPAFSEWFAFSNYTGMPATDVTNGGFDVVPGYPDALQNITCGNLIDTVAAIAISSAGCFGNVDFYTVTLYPTPILNHMDSIKVCSNQQVVVPSFTACPATSTISWTDAPPIGMAASGTGNITPFSGVNATSNPINSIVTAHATANTCVGPDSTFIIIISPLPVINSITSQTVCPNGQINAPTIATTPAGGVNLSWSAVNYAAVGLPASSIINPNPYPYQAPTNATLANVIGVITYTPTLNGCVGSPKSDSIVVKPTPVIQAISSQTFCPNSTAIQTTFTCMPNNPAATLYSWQVLNNVVGAQGSGITSSVPAFTTAANNTGSTETAVVSISASVNNCPSLPASYNIILYPTPTASFSAVPVCEGQLMNFTDLSTPNSGSNAVSSWAWDMNNDGFYNDASTQNPSYPVTPAGQDPIKLFVTTANTCTAVITQSVTVNPNPIPNFIADTLSGCPKLPVVFTDLSTVVSTASLPSNIQTWSWNFGNGQTASVLTPTVTPPLKEAMTYTNGSATTVKSYTVSLTVTTNAGCTATKTKNSYIKVSPRPIANFGWGPTDADIDDPAITFVNEAIGYGPYVPVTYGQYGVHYYLGDIYAYNPNSNYVDNNSSFTHTYDHYDTATYYVTQWVINSLGCKDSITKPVNILPNFTFYIPNAFSPNGDGTNDGFKGTGVGIDKATYNLWVFDRWGNMLFYSDDLEKAWDGHMKGNSDRPILQEDVYVWKVNFHDFKGKKHDFHGTVTLLK